jgi:hypothetical protein
VFLPEALFLLPQPVLPEPKKEEQKKWRLLSDGFLGLIVLKSHGVEIITIGA